MPVAITVTRTSSPNDSSIEVPKIIFTSLVAACVTISDASWASNNDKSGPPVIFNNTFSAPSTETSSNGEEIAFFVASAVRFSPVEEPTPIKADPWLAITVLTSAKSKLTYPGLVIKSEIPCTP